MTTPAAAEPSGRSAAEPRSQKAEAVYDDLRSRIIAGRLTCGDWLRAEAVADDLGVSRTPVREAFRQLHADGFIEIVPNRGARVARISDEDLEATYELHALLEGYAARRAAEQQLADPVALGELCTAMESALASNSADRFDRITQLNLQLHGDIHRASGNIVLPGMIAGFAQRSLVHQTFAHYTGPEIERSFAQHREMIDAIAAGDAALAEAVMRSHVLAARATLRRQLSGQSGAADQEDSA